VLFGEWIIPTVSLWLEAINCWEWLRGLLVDGIISGVGAVLGFVPQMLVLFFLLAFLEACGYMSRIAFVMDKLFRKFGLSGKSFIPLLIGTGCSVPGIMASRTIENERDRRITIITTSFIPCGAKLPVIALISGVIFGDDALSASLIAVSSFFVGIVAVIISGIILKKTKLFAGDAAPFVMELPAYHMPTAKNLLRTIGERAWSFIKKAGTVILLSAIVLWFLQYFGFEGGAFCAVEDASNSLLAYIGKPLAYLFVPLGFGFWQAAFAVITGLIAKENVVATLGVLYGVAEVSENGAEVWANFQGSLGPTPAIAAIAAFSFLVFNLLCAPCFAAVGAIRREMNSWKWTLFALGYQTVLAYAFSLVIYQLGVLFVGGFGAQGLALSIVGIALAVAVLIFGGYLLLRPDRNAKKVKN
jgi:ferrous iron transport protein B